MIKGQAGQVINGELINATTGAAFVGTVTVYVTVDNGTQALGVTGAGVATAKGNGTYQYAPTATETNGSLIAFTFIGTGAIPAVVNVATVTAAQQAAISVATSPGSITVLDLLTAAAKRVNILSQNETLDAFEGQDMLVAANFYLDALSIERLAVPFVLRTTWTMISGQASYSVGIGGDINITRPNFVDHVNYIDASLTPAIERELAYLTDDAYAAIPIKTQTNPLPSFYYWNPTYTSLQGTLSFWLVPTSSVLTGVLYAPSAVSQFGALSDTVALPPGYKFFLQENLAVIFATTFRENIPIDPNLLQSAALAKANIKRMNTRLIEMALGPEYTYGSPRSNIYVGP